MKNPGQTAAAAAAIFCVLSALSTGAARAQDTYRPECFAPASDNAKVIRYDKRSGPYRIAFVNGYIGNDWRTAAIQAAKAWAVRPENKAKLKEFTVVSVGNDSAAQIAAIDNFIAAGYDAITFIAVNPTAFSPVIRRAARAGTVLIPFDNTLDTDAVVQVNEDQFEQGALKARTVVQAIEATKGRVAGTVLEVSGLAGTAVDRDVHNGMRAVLAQYPDLKVVQVIGNWDAGTVQKVTADAIATNGQFDGVLVQEGAIGAINAMKNANHPVVPFAGDAGNGVRRLIAEGKYPGVTAAQAPAMSAIALAAAVALLEGERLPQKIFLPIPSKDNADLVAGVDYFPNLPDSFYTATGFPNCFPVFTPEELLGQTPDNT